MENLVNIGQTEHRKFGIQLQILESLGVSSSLPVRCLLRNTVQVTSYICFAWVELLNLPQTQHILFFYPRRQNIVNLYNLIYCLRMLLYSVESIAGSIDSLLHINAIT